jgi:hypothetical protein
MQILAGMALEAVARCRGRVSPDARDAVLAAARRLQCLTVYRRERTAWVDGLSANDPGAAARLVEMATREATRRGFSTAAKLFNHRADRPSRLPLFAGLLARGGPSWIVGAPIPAGWAARVRIPRLSGLPGDVVATIEDRVAERPGPTCVVCLGNTAGMGRALRQWLASHAEVESW